MRLSKADLHTIKNILKIDSIESIIKSGLVSHFIETNKVGVLGFFSGNKALIEFNEMFGSKCENKNDLSLILEKLTDVTLDDLKNLSDLEVFENIEEMILLVEEKDSFFNGIMKNDTFHEYFRTNLFKLNYSMYITSLNVIHQTILSKKSAVIKAISFFTADKPFQYLLDNYGKHKNEFLRNISLAYPVVSSTLAAINGMFSSIDMPYNLILADEAGMIASHSIVPALNKANRAIIVGDPKQLEPIVPINELFLKNLKEKYIDIWEKSTPTLISAFHRAAGTSEGGFKATGKGITLDEHRRCSVKIANLFIDIAEYTGVKISSPKIKNEAFEKINENLFFFDIANYDQESSKKINMSEVSKIETLLNRFESVGYDLTRDVGIITPYKDQESMLIEKFAKRLNHSDGGDAKIGTVHKFQGVEYKVVIFSTVISRPHDNLNFINQSPSMINVAISRTKEIFAVVGDFEKITKDDSYTNYIGRMSREIEKNGVLIRRK